MEKEKKEIRGQIPDANKKCKCQRCGKKLSEVNFFTHRDKSKFTMCKPCLTAHIDNFNPETFIWILKMADVPWVPQEWNKIRDAAFAKNPLKMNGMSVLGKYLAMMRLNQYGDKRFVDSDAIQEQIRGKELAKQQAIKAEKQRYEAQLKVKLSEGKISQAEYNTLVSTETQKKDLVYWGNNITGQNPTMAQSPQYVTMMGQMKNPFQQQNFMSEDEITDPGESLEKEDKMYLALKWGRLYTPSQWVALQQLYNQFMNSFDIQGAARVDTLKMICKTSLKMNDAIDSGDIDGYKKLSSVYDQLMKSAKFTQAQNKDKEGKGIDSASAIVDFVESHSGAIPRYECKEPQDLVDQIILDLKTYNRNLIYEDKSLAQQIEKYIKDKRISDQMKKDKKQAREKGLDNFELSDKDYVAFKDSIDQMKQHDDNLDDDSIELEYFQRRLNI